MKYILALDQGTTSSRAVLFDEKGAPVASHGIEFPQLYPKPVSYTHLDVYKRQSLRNIHCTSQSSLCAPVCRHARGAGGIWGKNA